MKDIYETMSLEGVKKEVLRVRECNNYTSQFGLSLSEEDISELMNNRKNNLREQQRVEFTKGVLPEIIRAFCDSPYIYQDNYFDSIIRLQEIFYEYKN